MNNEEMLEVVRNVLLAVRIGDGLGMAVETMTREEIRKVLGREGVREYLGPVQKRIHNTANFKAGNYTDDWQLTHANVGSFLQCDGYDPRVFALDHVAELDNSIAGWGGTTRDGLKQIKQYFETKGRLGRHYLVPAECGPNRGAGNGVAMQIAPFGMWFYLRQNGLYREPLMTSVLSLGQMTHSDPEALITPYLLAAAISYLMCRPGSVAGKEDIYKFLTFLTDEARAAETRLRVSTQVTHKLTNIICAVSSGELDEPSWPLYHLKTGVLAIQSVLYSIAKFLQNRFDFEKGVMEAVNDGGDTDSTASMTGALIAANGAKIPEWMLQWPNQTEDDCPYMVSQAAETFFYSALGQR